jgi:hypothetical protein
LQKKEFIQKEEISKLEQRVLKDRVETLETEIEQYRKDHANGSVYFDNK